jgi:uncharacterized protein YbaP (TraB family)
MQAYLRALAFLFGFALLPCVSGAAADTVTKATPAMWTVHGPKGTAYLLGSFHALPDNIDWQTPQIKAAIKHADVFVFEIPMDLDHKVMTGRMLGANMLLPVSRSLPSFFDSEMRSEWRAAIEHTQIQPESLVMMRPWFAAFTLRDATAGHVPIYAAEGVDNKVYAMAVARGVTDIRHFETADFQLRTLMGNATPQNELDLLRTAMRDAAVRPMMSSNKMLAAWESGDPRAIDATRQASDIAGNKALLDDRNHNWIPQIAKMLTEKRTFFITVGAFHLVGPNGVPNLLRAQGYQVDGPDQGGSAMAGIGPKLRTFD